MGSNGSALLNILVLLIPPIILLLGFIAERPVLGTFLCIVATVILLLIVHQKKVLRVGTVPGKTEKVFQFSENWRRYAGWGILIILVISNGLLLLPSTNHYIQSNIAPSATTTVTATPTTNQPVSIVEHTFTPTPTSTYTPTPEPSPSPTVTPTISPFASYLFRDGCIPNGWTTLIELIGLQDQPCLDYPSLRITPFDGGFDAYIAPTDHDYFNGLVMPIESNMKIISFDITIDQIINRPANISTNFFFGFFDKNKVAIGKPFGDFVIYRSLEYFLEDVNNILFGQSPHLADYPKQTVFKPGETQKIVLQLDPLTYTYQIEDIVYPSLKQIIYPNGERNFVIGFKVPVGSAVHFRIENFQVID